MAESGPILTVSSVEEELKKGKPVHFLNFRFSTAHQKWDHEKVHKEIMKRGWQKLPDLDNSYVWLGSNSPPEFIDILKKASYDNHVCRYMSGSLTTIGQLEGTGAAERKSPRHVTAPTSTLLDYPGFSKGDGVSQIPKTLPDVKQVKPVNMEEGGSD